jgi:hypothetical protein
VSTLAADLAAAGESGDLVADVIACRDRARSEIAALYARFDLAALTEIRKQADALSAQVVPSGYGLEARRAAEEIGARARRALALGVRRGQREGFINIRGRHPGQDHASATATAAHVATYLGTGATATYSYALADGISDDQFEAILEQARAEQDMTRAGLKRRARAVSRRNQTWHGRPTPGRASRQPLPEFTRDTAWRLRRDVERMERVFADDRFAAVKDQVAMHAHDHLKYAAEVCQDLLRRLSPAEQELNR